MRRALHAITARARRYVLLEGLAAAALFVLLACGLELLLDYSARLSIIMRAACLMALLAGTAAIVWRRVIEPLRIRVELVDAAKLVERKHPELSSALVSAVQFDRGEIGSDAANSRELAASVVRKAATLLDRVEPARLLDAHRARRAVALLTFAGLCIAVSIVVAPAVVGLWFQRNILLQNVDWWQRTHLIVDAEGNTIHAARGDDVEIRARIQGVVPRQVEILFRAKEGHRGQEPMVFVGGDTVRHTFWAVQDDLVFHLRGGDARTEEYRVVLAERPRVEFSEVEIAPPSYTNLDPVVLRDGQRSADVLPGTDIRIWIETNKDVASAILMAGDVQVSAGIPEGNRWLARFSPERTQAYHFDLVDETGLESRNPMRFAFRVTPDDPPAARFTLMGAGEMITPEAVVPVEVEFSDLYGLRSVELRVDVEADQPRTFVVDLPGFKANAANFTATVAWSAESAAAQAGERVTFSALATDFDDVSGPNVGRAQDRTLQVVTRDELLNELVRREHELRLDFERIVEAQERLRGDTLSVVREMLAGGTPASIAAALAPLERRQRSIAGSLNVVRQQFERIVEERRINRLDTRADMERLGPGIVEPLTRLARRDAPAAGDVLRRLAADLTPEASELVDRQQVDLINSMQSILANMLQWEGYQEILTMLRDIIELEQELSDELQADQLKGADELFDD